MAVYRQLHVSYWQDSFVLDLTPEEKYFYVYLLTNSKTKQCGCYEISKKVIELETGYNRETVEKLIKRFIEYRKIAYNEATKEILIINWLNYNSYKSPKVMQCILKEIELIKCAEFRKKTMDRLSIDSGEEEEKEEEKEKEEEQEESTCAREADGLEDENEWTKEEGPIEAQVMQDYNEIFSRCWQKPLQLTDKRRKQIRARLRKYSRGELSHAMINMTLDGYLIGEHPKNPDGKVYATPEYVFRNDENIEKFLQVRPMTQGGFVKGKNYSRPPIGQDEVNYDDPEMILRLRQKAAKGEDTRDSYDDEKMIWRRMMRAAGRDPDAYVPDDPPDDQESEPLSAQ